MADVNAVGAILAAEEALAKAEALYADKKAEFDAVSAAYAKLRGGPAPGTVQALVKEWLPKVAVWAGLPGAGVLASAVTADPGAFGGLVGVVKRLAAVFGLGG